MYYGVSASASLYGCPSGQRCLCSITKYRVTSLPRAPSASALRSIGFPFCRGPRSLLDRLAGRREGGYNAQRVRSERLREREAVRANRDDQRRKTTSAIGVN